MKKENGKQKVERNDVYTTSVYYSKILTPLQMEWQPKEDITAYELAMYLPYLSRIVMPYEINVNLPHFRHFKITNNN